MSGWDPQIVGRNFVKRMYTEGFVEENGLLSASCKGFLNAQQLHEKLMPVNIGDSLIKILSVDSEGTKDNTIIVKVIGEIVDSIGLSKGFRQTFILVQRREDRYVLKDGRICYLDSSTDKQENIKTTDMGDKVASEIGKWSTPKKRHFIQDVSMLFENDPCETIQELKNIINKDDFPRTKEVRALLKHFGKQKWRGNLLLIKKIRNILVHYRGAQEIGNHPDDIFEQIEAVSPQMVLEIMYAIIKLCKDVWHGRYICKYTTLPAHIGALLKPEEIGMEQVGHVLMKKEYKITFDEIVSKEELLREIYASGYETPSPFQADLIQKCNEGQDVIVQAQAGTGKVTSICIAVLQKLDYSSRTCQAVVLANTKGLAEKIRKELEALGHNMGVKCCTCYAYEDAQKLQNRTAHVLIGINGAVQNVFTEGFLDPGSIRMVVIDEADLILSDGRFRSVVYDLLKLMPKHIQKIVCSGAVTQGKEDIEKLLMTEPFYMKEELTLDGLQQYKIRVEKKSKLEALWYVYEQFSIIQAVIFCDSHRKADTLTEEMSSKYFSVSVLHSNVEQDEIHAFNSGLSRILVTTDQDLHEIDIRNVSHIINFDFPHKAKDYIRRIGLLKRFERKGIVIILVTKDDEESLRYIERFYQTRIEHYEL